MEKKKWFARVKNVAGTLFLLFLVNVSCFASWYVINNPPAEKIPEKAIKIGLLIDPTHYSGVDILRGAQMAVDEINAEGGVNVGDVSMPLVLVTEDTEEMSPDVGVERTVSAVTKLITTHKVNVVMGSFATFITAAETCVRYKTIYITASPELPVTEPVIADYEKYKYVFSIMTNSTVLGMEMVNFYTWLRGTYGFTKVAIIAEEYMWIDPIIGYFREHVPEGMTIVYEVRFPSTVTTFMPYLIKAKDNGAQLIMPLIALDWGITFIKEWAAMQYGLTAGITSVASRSTFWEETDGEAKYYLDMTEAPPPSNITEKSNFYNSFMEN